MFQTVVDKYEVFDGFNCQDDMAFYAVDSCVFSYKVKQSNIQDINTEPFYYLKKIRHHPCSCQIHGRLIFLLYVRN